MPVPSISFLLGIIVLGYLSTFVVFAILRIVTGVSIQRVGFSGLRHIALSPRNGIKIHIRGVGFSIHRPTFALPTWCSLVITELGITVDLEALKEREVKSADSVEETKKQSNTPPGTKETSGASEEQDGHGKLWRQLTEIKEKLKRLHSNIHWIKLVDLVATNATVNVVGVGSLCLERVTLSVDTRHKTVDRSRLFQHHKTTPDTQSPAEWKSLIRSILFTPEGRDSTEILDYCTINIHGMLHNQLQGLRDASIALKLGRLNIPYDDLEHAKKSADLIRGNYAASNPYANVNDISIADLVEDTEHHNRNDRIVRTVSDSRAFVASILRGIQEVQFAVSFFGLSKKMDLKGHSDNDVYFNLAMKEVGLDVLRLDPKSPAHRMYFATKDVAHQGLVTAIAISAGIDDGHEHPERMAYIPMITATIKTTLPSRTIYYSQANSVNDRNTNMLYANFVCTSPSIDLDPKHLPLLREILKQRSSKTNLEQQRPNRHRLISQLLPKAHVKFSIQEPVIRISLPPLQKEHAADDDYDLLISSVSSVSVELESSHESDGGVRYNLGLHYRHTRHHLYYQTAFGERHDLLQSDTVEVDVNVNAIPDATVTATAQFKTFTLFLVRPDICEGVRQIVKQLRRNVLVRKDATETKTASFLRRLPAWLHECRLEGTRFSLELAGVDEAVSPDTRGFAVQLESWTTEYKALRDEPSVLGTHRRVSTSRSSPSRERPSTTTNHDHVRKRPHNFADGRRLTVHLQNLEGLILESAEDADLESFLSVPRFEVAFSTSTDTHGPIFHINSFAKSVLLQYSLYNHFALGVAIMVIKKTFIDHRSRGPDRPHHLVRQPSLHLPSTASDVQEKLDDIARREIVTLDFKSKLIQVKAKMPADPPLMLQVYNIETGRHRWASPFLRARLVRLYVRAPQTKAAWSRIVVVKNPRLDIRDHKRRVGKRTIDEKSIDISSDSIRFNVPHSLVVHDIFDNITNVIKTSKQLQHHFTTGTNDYILTKEPEGPKVVPRICLRSQLVLLDLEDSTFEWKLGAIYRTGLQEQKQRLARDEAFRLKENRLTGNSRRRSSRFRTQSARPRERSTSTTRDEPEKRRSRSSQPRGHHSHHRHPRRKMRYDAEGQCGLSDTSQLTIKQAKEKLHLLNAQTWKRRIDRVLSLEARTVREIRQLVGTLDEPPEDSENQEPILAMNMRPGLLIVYIVDLSLTIDKPSFPIDEYSKFLHDVGKGMPKDMQYGLLVPMSLHLAMGELRFQLRDYPLPLLHVPPLANGQSPRLHALTMKTDFVIAEEFRDIESQREVDVLVIPPEKMSDKTSKGYSINVRRTISPVKTYSDMKFEINTSRPTIITWGTSYQPAIQDTMQVVENFTKPPVDPSDRVGFWDKIRLSFHSRVNIAWKGDGDLHLVLKGSRDPYVVTGNGAGLVMVWRNDVRWNVAQSEDPRQFMTVDSGEYILAVPDFNSYERRHQDEHDDGSSDGNSSISSTSRKAAVFKKVVMKLSGNVRWLAGLMFERERAEGGRCFDFKPHYDVVLKQPAFAKAVNGEEYDAYRDFRSHHIHMSIGILAPQGRDWSVNNVKPSDNYNSVHLTPRFFAHFFNWWSMFSGVMSLPIRQGPLWGPIQQKKSKKFGRHIATIKYNLLLSPLYISHVYKHKDAEDYQANAVSATGLKLKMDSFMLDLHQRREHFDIHGNDSGATKQTSGIRINQAQLDFIHADLRALSATIAGTSREDIDNANEETVASLQDQLPMVDMSKFEIPDNDLTWIDMDDFVELDWILPAEADPETKILPLGFAPRFTYFRQTDHGGTIAGDPSRTSPFGDEPSHYCVMSAKNDPRRVQAALIEKRLEDLETQKAQNQRAIGDHQLQLVQCISEDKASRDSIQSKLDMLIDGDEHLQKKQEFLQSMLDSLEHRLREGNLTTAVPDFEKSETFFEAPENGIHDDTDLPYMDSSPMAEYTSDFNNRFIVHNAQIKWNNALRNIILRYIHQNSQRRGFVYYMSRRAVKFILDVLEKRDEEQPLDLKRQKSFSTQMSALSPDVDDEQTVQDRIEQLLNDGRNFVNADESPPQEQNDAKAGDGHNDEIAVEFTPLNVYHLRLIAPQVQLQSEKNPNSAVLVTAKGMQLKVVQIMDKDNVNDDVNGLVQRRFNAEADSLQMFVTRNKKFATGSFHMYSANLYGTKAGTRWPPWVPLEIMFGYHADPYGFNRVVPRTSASLRYDKYNNLRLKYRDNVTGGEDVNEDENDEGAEERMDRVWIEFPQFRAICDSMQYYALYIIVMDLLLYSEPLEKTRSERLEKIMLASDFSDLTDAPRMVEMLQDRIRQLEEIKMHFQVNEEYLDRQGWKDRISIDHDLAACEDELFFMMKAITTSQQRQEGRREQENATGLLHLNLAAREIAWHLIREKNESLVEFQLKNASFDRYNYNDGSNYNVIELGQINGFNLLPDALYPEIIAPFTDVARGGREADDMKMLRVHWLMLEAIAGIPVVDSFEVDLVPLQVQVEREVAKKLFEYIFPGVGEKAFDSGTFSPLSTKNKLPTQAEENEDREMSGTATPQEHPPKSAGSGNSPVLTHGPGSLEQRMKPTLYLSTQTQRPKSEHRGLGISHGHHHAPHSLSVFTHSEKSRSSAALTQRSNASRQALSTTNISAMSRSPSERSLTTMRSNAESRESKRFQLPYVHNDDKKSKKGEDRSDDLTQMLNRASNYMILAFVKIPTMVLCLSYKGQGKRNIEDVHDLVFRLPTLEYRNKTWSNLDLALQLKKDVIRALISHTGAIIGNKFSHHKPSKLQPSRLREIANRSVFMSSKDTEPESQSITSSFNDFTSDEVIGRPSTTSGRPSTMQDSIDFRTTSTSSINDVDDYGHGNGRPTSSRSVPARPQFPDEMNGDSTRPQGHSIARHLTGISERLRNRQSDANSVTTDENEETRRKSKILLGGQKFFRTLRDQS